MTPDSPARGAAPSAARAPAASPEAPRRRGRSGLYLLLGIGLALLKSRGLIELLNHRTGTTVFFTLALLVCILRARPVGMALLAGLLVAFAWGPHLSALGLALGLGTTVLLLASFVGIATVLRRRPPPRPGRRRAQAECG